MNLLELLIKGAGHKYIKRIPVGTTKTGKVRYRYIYRADHTVGGKHLLDEAHLKAGTKLLLHSKDGAEVHAHIDSVKGDQVTFTYDDGDRKGETRTVSKQKLLAEFNKENKVEDKITSAKAALLADIKAAADRGTSKKQLARLVARLERLGGKVEPEQEKPKEGTLAARIRAAAAAAAEKRAKGVELPQLGKDLLAKHQVNPEQVQASIEDFKKTRAYAEGNSDVMYLRRLERLERDGIDQATSTYNAALDRAAKDNADVLKAIETYKEIVNPYGDPEQLNKLIARKEESYKGMLNRSTWNQYGYDLEDRATLTYSAIKKQSGKYLADYIAYETKRDTGVDIQKTKQTIQEAYTQLSPNDSLVNKYKRENSQSIEASNAMDAVVKAVGRSCISFNIKQAVSDRADGDTHEHHVVMAGGTRGEIAGKHAKELARIEDIFQRAYPERAEGLDVRLVYSSDSRASAELLTNTGKCYLNLPRGHSLRTAAHELAHTLEGKSSGTPFFSGDNKAERDGELKEFMMTPKHLPYQNAIQEAVTLTHLSRIKRGEHSVYSGKERTFDDDYHSEYAGKIYDDGASELVTMGVQEMFKSNDNKTQHKHIAAFAARDPHHFLVTYAVLKGYTKHEK